MVALLITLKLIKMIYYQIYLIENKINNKNYIGQHKIDTTRKDNYFGSGIYIKRAIKKYGIDNFNKYELEIFYNKYEADFYEKLYIKFYRLENKAEYNIANGGEGASGYNHTEEFKRKISKIHKGNKYNLGVKRSEETKQKISKANKGKKHGGGKRSKETKQKMSNIYKERISEETRQKMRDNSLKVRQEKKEQRLNDYKYLNKQEIMKKYNISRKTVWLDIKEINSLS
jgi:group I intron endonuclease